MAGASRIQLKDMETIIATADEMGIDLPLARNVRDRYRRLVDEMGEGALDHAALLLELEATNAPARIGDAPDKRP